MTPWVTRLLIANVGVYFVQIVAPAYLPVLADLFWFYPPALLSRPWTPLTYMFFHDPSSVMHLAFNMLGLYFFGPALEARLGGRRFLLLYFTGGIFGAILSMIMSPGTPIIGASAALYAVMFGFARYWPHTRILLFMVIPVEARLLVIIMTVMSLWGGFGMWGSGIAHFAHLGGFVGGWLFLKWLEWRAPNRRFKERAMGGSSRGRSDAADLRRWATIPRDALHPLNREEVERIFAKIETSGVKSLTAEERASLDRFSQQQVS